MTSTVTHEERAARYRQSFREGDRVRLEAADAMNWRSPTLRRIAESGRPGTVAKVFGTEARPWARSYIVTFDPARKGSKAVREEFRPVDLVRIEGGQA